MLIKFSNLNSHVASIYIYCRSWMKSIINYICWMTSSPRLVSSKLLRGNRDEREHDALQCFFSKFVIYPKWQSSVGRRCRKNWQLVPRRFSQIWVYKLDMKYKSLINFLDLWLHIEKQM